MKSKLCLSLLVILVFILLIGNLSAGDISQNTNKKESINWPSFRGLNASGIADGYPTPLSWDIAKSINIKWKTAIPGLGHSSPAVWENRIFITTAVSDKAEPELKVGLYGDIESAADQTVHEWKVYCIDKNTGKILWEKTAHKGIPKVKRHPKSSHANPTPATDGKYVAAFFGSEGLYCYDMNGQLAWKKDFGILDANFFLVPEAQWGFASSPAIHKGVVVVQCDVRQNSFIAALDVRTGKQLWKIARDEYPTWSTPTIYDDGRQDALVFVNGYKHIGCYDFKTGKEVWKMKGGGDIPVPTPVAAQDLVFINSAHGMMSPIYAVKLTAKGDITLKELETANEHIAWSVKRGGAYMQTPLIYGDYLYNLQVNGSLTCYKAKTGESVYKENLGNMDSFSASGVAADGKLYFAGESGEVYVVKAGAVFKILAVNSFKDICMATPAISQGVLFFRTQHYLIAAADKQTNK